MLSVNETTNIIIIIILHINMNELNIGFLGIVQNPGLSSWYHLNLNIIIHHHDDNDEFKAIPFLNQP